MLKLATKNIISRINTAPDRAELDNQQIETDFVIENNLLSQGYDQSYQEVSSIDIEKQIKGQQIFDTR